MMRPIAFLAGLAAASAFSPALPSYSRAADKRVGPVCSAAGTPAILQPFEDRRALKVRKTDERLGAEVSGRPRGRRLLRLSTTYTLDFSPSARSRGRCGPVQRKLFGCLALPTQLRNSNSRISQKLWVPGLLLL
jgi:hypothetical protein